MNDNFFLLYKTDTIHLKEFERFSYLCDYVNDNNLHKKCYKVFDYNMYEISQYEYSIIPNPQ